MRIRVSMLTALGTLSFASISTPALAGCGYNTAPQGCGNFMAPAYPVMAVLQPVVPVMPVLLPRPTPVSVQIANPMGHLRSVNFRSTPNVTITRVHSQSASASIYDAPSAISGGCFSPCGVSGPATVSSYSSGGTVVSQAPQYVSQPVTQNYNAPRQYGSSDFVPGIAHIPTSIVDRDPNNADIMLNSGRAVAQPIANGGYAPRPVMSSAGAPDGTYWEKVAGPTRFGNTVATQVICKRQGPVQAPVQVIRPVIGVPVPAANNCVPSYGSRYGQNSGSPWTY